HFHGSSHHPHLPSFPTRRYSDLMSSYSKSSCAFARSSLACRRGGGRPRRLVLFKHGLGERVRQPARPLDEAKDRHEDDKEGEIRSEEHTSEVQSRENLVCRHLLE